MKFDLLIFNFVGSNRGGMAKKVKKCSTSEAFNARDIEENPFAEVKMTNYYANGHFMVSLLLKKSTNFRFNCLSLINYHDLKQMLPTKFSREHSNKFVGTAFLQVGKDMPSYGSEHEV
jgi:hypothetical protein